MFCRFCGQQTRDEAYVCPACGGQLKAFPAELFQDQIPYARPTQPSRKFFRLAKIFSIIATALSGITLLGGAWFVFMLCMGMVLGGDGGLLLVIFSVYGMFAMVGFAPFALTTGIMAFVFKKKSLQPTGKFPIFAFIFGITAFVIGFGSYIFLIVV